MAHRNLTSSSLNDISDKPEKDQVSQGFLLLCNIRQNISRRCWEKTRNDGSLG